MDGSPIIDGFTLFNSFPNNLEKSPRTRVVSHKLVEHVLIGWRFDRTNGNFDKKECYGNFNDCISPI